MLIQIATHNIQYKCTVSAKYIDFFFILKNRGLYNNHRVLKG
jgi:hypothetical protein